MATSKHPITGVELNDITIKRKRLSFEEAVTAHILHRQKRSFTDIVHMLGTNANRVGEVFNGKVHPNAAKTALNLLTH